MNSNMEHCCICNEVLQTLNRTTLLTIQELLKFLIVKVNSKLIEESAICNTCLAKIHSACKFKMSYLDGLQKTVTDVRVKEETNPKKCIGCEICKTTNQIACILFDSVTEGGFNLIRYLSVELESKIQEKSLTCETCHKSLINFYDITNLLTIYNEDNFVTITESDIANDIYEKEIQEMHNDLSSTSTDRDCKDFIFEMNSVDLGKKNELDDFHEEFVLKNEEVDLKMQSDDDIQMTRQLCGSEITETISQKNGSANMFKCQSCEYKTKCKGGIKTMCRIHKSIGNVRAFIHKCQICEFKTKYKGDLYRHMTVHKPRHTPSEEVEMFKCAYCELTSPHKVDLERHMHTKILELKPSHAKLVIIKPKINII